MCYLYPMSNTNTPSLPETLTAAQIAAREDEIHAREMAEYEARMMRDDADWEPCDDADPVDLYGGDDYSNEYMEGDQGWW